MACSGVGLGGIVSALAGAKEVSIACSGCGRLVLVVDFF